MIEYFLPRIVNKNIITFSYQLYTYTDKKLIIYEFPYISYKWYEEIIKWILKFKVKSNSTILFSKRKILNFYRIRFIYNLHISNWKRNNIYRGTYIARPISHIFLMEVQFSRKQNWISRSSQFFCTFLYILLSPI